MPKEKFRSLTVDEKTYEKLKKVAEERRLPVSRAVAVIVDEAEVLGKILENTEKILSALSGSRPEAAKDLERVVEELRKKIEEIEARLKNLEERYDAMKVAYDYLRERVEGQGENRQGKPRSKMEKVVKAFLGEAEPVRIKGTPIVVRKAEFFIENVQPDDVRDIAEKHNAAAVPELDAEDNVIGASVVPNSGFNADFSLEKWFEEHGSALLSELTERFRGGAA